MIATPAIIGAMGGGLAGAAITYGVFAPGSGIFGRVISRGTKDNPPRVALTFDDGPDGEATPAILDVLRERQVPAAFFVIGRNVERWPDIVRRAHAEGHLIANHTYDHHRWGAWCGLAYWRAQLHRTSQAIHAATHQQTGLFRPPMGIKTPMITLAARREGMTIVTWNRRGLDGWPTTADAILRRLSARCAAGDILVLHDGAEPGRQRDPKATLKALPSLIVALRERGLQFERLDRLIAGVEPRRNGEINS